MRATLEAQMIHHQQQIWQAFNNIDTDGSGSITVDELRKVLKDEPAEEIEKYIAEYDKDKVSTPAWLRARHGVLAPCAGGTVRQHHDRLFFVSLSLTFKHHRHRCVYLVFALQDGMISYEEFLMMLLPSDLKVKLSHT